MIRTALIMLVGDRAKFLGIVFGLAFAAVLMTQQGGIFRGVMVLTYGLITDTPHADLWISDPGIPELDQSEMLVERDLDNVRAAPGVAWAVPFLRRYSIVRRPDQRFANTIINGVDDGTLVGAPLPEAMIEGRVEDLRRPDSVIVDAHGAATKLRVSLPGGGSRPLRMGDTIQLSTGGEITVVGLCRSSLSVMTVPSLYMRRSQLAALDPDSDRAFSFILAGLAAGADHRAVAQEISRRTGLKSRSRKEISDQVYDYYLYETGIPANFAVAVILGFVVGAAIAGQTFNQFVSDNRKVFAALKAMGMTNLRMAGILVIQALATAAIGYGLGLGVTVGLGALLEGTDLAFRLEYGLMAFSGISVLLLSLGAALLSLRAVLRLDPALVFRS